MRNPVPEVPGLPEVPGVPEVPGLPEVPGVPEGAPHQVFSEPRDHDGVTVITVEAAAAPLASPGRWVSRRAGGARPVGAYAIVDGRVRWHPAVDVTRVVTTAELVAGAVLITHHLTRRASAPKAAVTMGPGGWVSMKGGTVAVRPVRRPWGRPRAVPVMHQDRAPLWARVISAVPLQKLL
jgi:hypothetical protein